MVVNSTGHPDRRPCTDRRNSPAPKLTDNLDVTAAVFIAPHCDDPFVGATSALLEAIGRGDRTVLVNVTDDVAPAGAWDLTGAERLLIGKAAKTRRSYFDRMVNLTVPQRKTIEHWSEIVDGIRAVIESEAPSSVYVPAYEGGHVDHDVAAKATIAAARRSGRQVDLFEFAEYHRRTPNRGRSQLGSTELTDADIVHNSFGDAAPDTKLSEAMASVRVRVLRRLQRPLGSTDYLVPHLGESIRLARARLAELEVSPEHLLYDASIAYRVKCLGRPEFGTVL